MDVINEYLGLIASLIGSLTVVGGAMIWLYNTIIAKPRDRWKERLQNKRQQAILEEIENANKPVNDAIEKLNRWLEDSQRDRDNLNKIADKNSGTLKRHKEILDDHDDRLIVLETKNGLRYKRGGD